MIIPALASAAVNKQTLIRTMTTLGYVIIVIGHELTNKRYKVLLTLLKGNIMLAEQFNLTMSLSNDAFVCDDNQSRETARILREIADRIDGHPHFSPGHSQPIRDHNGNEVGNFDVN